jgi:hypothetical protein
MLTYVTETGFNVDPISQTWIVLSASLFNIAQFDRLVGIMMNKVLSTRSIVTSMFSTPL